MLTQSMISEYKTIIDKSNNYSSSSCEFSLNGIKLKLSMDRFNKPNNISNLLDSTKTSHVKKERLSPRVNGYNSHLRSSNVTQSRSSPLRSSPLRSSPMRSSPLQCNDLENRNLKNRLLSTENLDNCSDFATRNYSDFMRSLAAKYNKNNINSEFNNENRHSLPHTETTSSNKVAKNFPSVSDINKTQNKPIVTAVSPLVTSLLSSLQFTANAFPPLIDMSSTQALVTLARASKEVEIKNILRTARKRRHDSSAIDNQPPPKINIKSFDSNLLFSPFLLSAQNIQQQTLNSALSKVVKISSTDNNSNNNNTIIAAAPLDLSSAQIKRTSLNDQLIQDNSITMQNQKNLTNTTIDLKPEIKFECQIEKNDIKSWTVDDVCRFVGNINTCAPYIGKFREQCIDGYGLPLLTENHLINVLGMKLGPALKLRTILAKKLGGPCPCISCTVNHNLLISKSTINSIGNISHHHNHSTDSNS